jgi:hypothetical protein
MITSVGSAAATDFPLIKTGATGKMTGADDIDGGETSNGTTNDYACKLAGIDAVHAHY